MKRVLHIALPLLVFLVACEPNKANLDATTTAWQIETDIAQLEATINAEATLQAAGDSTPIPPSTVPEGKTPSPTMTAFQGASVEVLVNANCRSGPGTIYPVITAYFAGEIVKIIGNSPDGMWRVVQIAKGDSRCWIWGELIAILGIQADLPTFAMPPTPEVPAAGPG
ncbi:MAG: SH3 domain-containing protein, partial [Anaerolineaceae bacterium]|nr:SH3 domain-containing protein [Anaerolineaceae bacterium]